MSAIVAVPGGGATSTDAFVAQLPQKSPTRQAEPKNRPDIINPVSLCGVIKDGELKALLRGQKQPAWCSRVRVQGLLLLIDYICRNLKTNGLISISADLAHQFVSKLRVRDRCDIPTEPLLLLCRLGILEKKRAAVFAHVRASATYCFTEKYSHRRLKVELRLPAKLAAKLEQFEERRERRLNRKYRFRPQLLNALNCVSLTVEARSIAARAFAGKGRDNMIRLVAALDGGDHFVRVSERGQITTSVSNCPKGLQPHLLLHGQPIVSCDISHAQWNFLPAILANRLCVSSGLPRREKYIADGWREHDRLTLLLSERDFYSAWCADPQNADEREEKKKVFNILLHQRNEDCRGNRLYRKVAEKFPITFAIIEDIKRNDHRNLSKQLHRFLAEAIAAALVELQQKRIPTIPNVDTLFCQDKSHPVVCETVGKWIFLATGVCTRVDGIRYSPLTQEEEDALTFDDTAPANDNLSYDEWEAIRFVKMIAALKVLRRPSEFLPLLSLETKPAGAVGVEYGRWSLE